MISQPISTERFTSNIPEASPHFTKREAEEFRQKLIRMGLLSA
jgi:hypothetical protein